MQILTHLLTAELGFVLGGFFGIWLAKQYLDDGRQAYLEALSREEMAEAYLHDAAEAYAAAARCEQRAKDYPGG